MVPQHLAFFIERGGLQYMHTIIDKSHNTKVGFKTDFIHHYYKHKNSSHVIMYLIQTNNKTVRLFYL